MGGSGLVEALQCCYGPNSIAQMISGKAVSRAIRGHFLIESALTVILLRHVISCADILYQLVVWLSKFYLQFLKSTGSRRRVFEMANQLPGHSDSVGYYTLAQQTIMHTQNSLQNYKHMAKFVLQFSI